MKSKIILLCLVAAACAVTMFSRRTLDRVASVAVPEKSETPVPAIRPKPSDRSDERTAQNLRAAAPTDTAALLAKLVQELASTNGESRAFALTNLLPALVLADPAAAGHFAETNSIEETRDIVLQDVAKLLAARDPTNAIAWAGALSVHDEREAALTQVCLQLAEANPADAIRLRESFLAEYQSFDALEDLAQRWAERDLPATLAWIYTHPADVRRDQLIGRVAYVQALTSPADAAALVTGYMTPGDAQIEAAVSVLHQWGRQDLAAASRWAQNFPEGPLRDRALNELSGIANEQRQASGN